MFSKELPPLGIESSTIETVVEDLLDGIAFVQEDQRQQTINLLRNCLLPMFNRSNGALAEELSLLLSRVEAKGSQTIQPLVR